MSDDLQYALGWAIVILAFALGLASVIVAGNWSTNAFTTDHAVYELETGEYLDCTPQGGNHLTCEVKHRKDTK